MAIQQPTLRSGYVNWGEKPGFPDSQDIRGFVQDITESLTNILRTQVHSKVPGTENALLLLKGCERTVSGYVVTDGLAALIRPGVPDGEHPADIIAPLTGASGSQNYNLYYHDQIGDFNDSGSVTSGTLFREYLFATAAPDANWQILVSGLNLFGARTYDLTEYKWNNPWVFSNWTAFFNQLDADGIPSGYYTLTGTIGNSTYGAYGGAATAWTVIYAGLIGNGGLFPLLSGFTSPRSILYISTIGIYCQSYNASTSAWGNIISMKPQTFMQSDEPQFAADGDWWIEL